MSHGLCQSGVSKKWHTVLPENHLFLKKFGVSGNGQGDLTNSQQRTWRRMSVIDAGIVEILAGGWNSAGAEGWRRMAKDEMDGIGLGMLNNQCDMPSPVFSASMWPLQNTFATRSSRAWHCAIGFVRYAGTHAY